MSTTPSLPPNLRGALARLRSGQPVFGLVQTAPGPFVTELAVWSGFDFVVVDCEHGIIDEPAHVASLQVISGSEAFAVVRVRPGDVGAISRYLDFGAAGILMPNVRTPAEATALVAAATYGPKGTRSSTGSALRAARYGLGPQTDPAPPLLLAMIESAQGVENIGAIAQTPGLDGLVIGPYDLSADLGCANDFSAAAYTRAFTEIERAAARTGRLLGSAAFPGFPVQRLLSAGHRFIVASVDTLALRDGFRSHLAAARGTES